MSELTVLRTSDLPHALERQLRSLMDVAFDGEFTDQDWEHGLGGWHAIVHVDGQPVAHASVALRVLDVGERSFQTGYVESVATAPEVQGAGHGSRVMAAIGDVLRDHFEFGALSTGAHGFYERLGWERWQGPTYVLHDGERVRTPDEDWGIMVLRFGTSAEVALTDPIACRSRSGDDW